MKTQDADLLVTRERKNFALCFTDSEWSKLIDNKEFYDVFERVGTRLEQWEAAANKVLNKP